MGIGGSRASKSAGFLDVLDRSDGVDVVTSVVTDLGHEEGAKPLSSGCEAGAGADRINQMELRAENEVFADLAPIAWIALAASQSLG